MVFSEILPYLFGGGGLTALIGALVMWRKVRAESDQTTVTTAQGVLTMQMSMLTQVKAELVEERKAHQEELKACHDDCNRRMEERSDELDALRRLIISKVEWQDKTDKTLKLIHTETNSTLAETLQEVRDVKKQNEILIKRLAESEGKK